MRILVPRATVVLRFPERRPPQEPGVSDDAHLEAP
jgi:hypothetical protein